jgi:hypothetical protein
LFFRKRKAEEEQKWKIYQYKQVIERCYRWETVGLALCSSTKFVGFNFHYDIEAPKEECTPILEDTFQMHGVVHEFGSHELHISCEVEIYNSERADTLGWLALTFADLETDKNEEERSLFLQVKLFDFTLKLRSYLFEGLRDAALSGFRFMHVGLGCDKPTEQDVTIAMSKMCEHGYGPTREIRQIKMWPKVELQNSPQWARQRD